MSHNKLKDLINDAALYFPNATRLTDQYEVTLPEKAISFKRQQLQQLGLDGRDLEEELAIFHWEKNPMKDLVLVNCWSLSPYESYALWKIYLGNHKNGVAIRTTAGALKRSIKHGGDTYPEDFYMGKVRYRHHLKQEELESQLARLAVVTSKKPFYDFEKEMRLFILNYPLSEGGITPPYNIHEGRTVKVDLRTMIHHVYISPFADESYTREVGTLLKSAGLRIDLIKQSEIKDK